MMFLSNSAFGVVASSTPQMLIIDHERPCNSDIVKDRHLTADDVVGDNHLSTFGARKTQCTFHQQKLIDELCLDQPLDLSTQKKTPKDHTHFTTNERGRHDEVTIGNVRLDTGDDYKDSASDIKITNVRSLATGQRTSRGDCEEEIISERKYSAEVRQPKGMLSMPDGPEVLSNREENSQEFSYQKVIGSSPLSICGLKKIRPRPYRNQLVINDEGLVGNCKRGSTVDNDTVCPVPVTFKSHQRKQSKKQN